MSPPSMAREAMAYDPNGHPYDMARDLNYYCPLHFPLSEATSPMTNYDLSAIAFTKAQSGLRAVIDFDFQYPESMFGTDEIDEWLQPQPDYRNVNQGRDLLLPVPEAPMRIRSQSRRSDEISQQPRTDPLESATESQKRGTERYPMPSYDHQDHSNQGKGLLLSQRELHSTQPQPENTPVEWKIAAVDGYKAPWAETGPESHQYPAIEDHHLGNGLNLLTSTNANLDSQRCFECCFAHKPCTISVPGFPCDRCTKLYDNMYAAPRHSKLLNDASALSIDTVIFFDMKSTQHLLSRLRGAAEAITNLQPGMTLEDYFKGSIVCHMDNRFNASSSFSVTGVPVVVKHLATTQAALAIAESSNQEFPLPGLDDIQMDSFIDVTNRMHNLQDLHPSEQAIIVTALRCSDYIGILFNWDLNAICFEGIASVPQAKNLVLETAYAISYRVQQLLMMLCHEVNHSLLGNRKQDPATVACALRIVYQSIDRFKKLKWNAGSLQELKLFLNGLHERAPAALKALDRYRVNVSFLRCGQISPNVKPFQALIDAKKTPKSAISFTFEHFRENEIFLAPPKSYSRQTYTEVLETRVNWDEFSFFPSNFDQIYNQTLQKEKRPSMTRTPSQNVFENLMGRYEASNEYMYAPSFASATSGMTPAFDGASGNGYTTMTSLTDEQNTARRKRKQFGRRIQ